MGEKEELLGEAGDTKKKEEFSGPLESVVTIEC